MDLVILILYNSAGNIIADGNAALVKAVIADSSGYTNNTSVAEYLVGCGSTYIDNGIGTICLYGSGTVMII